MWCCCVTCVDVGVFLHIRFLVKSLAAVLAWVRPRVRVDQQVSGQRRGAFESLPAHLALETSFLYTQNEKRYCIMSDSPTVMSQLELLT